MNVVMIIPTGIGCEIGGHAGDANPAAKLLGSVCDSLFLHPNVVNGSDINEMPANSLYVEGSILDRFLEGSVQLLPVKSNRILLVGNAPLAINTINAASAARATLGAQVDLLELKTPLEMIGMVTSEYAYGEVSGWVALVNQVRQYDFDALAIASPVEVETQIAKDYLQGEIKINPWGAVEAKASRLIASELNKPVAHAPTEDPALKGLRVVVDPRIAAEMLSAASLHCVLKGLHKAPRVETRAPGLAAYSAEDVDCLVTPIDCLGPPHEACLEKGIPIIAVEENTTALAHVYREEFIYVKNYLEAAGMIKAMSIGITAESVSRPLEPTRIRK